MWSNFNRISIGDYEIYFSYETPVVIRTPEWIYATNYKHSSTTSKHINTVAVPSSKIDDSEFQKKLNKVFKSLLKKKC